jgi:hypothetical protein
VLRHYIDLASREPTSLPPESRLLPPWKADHKSSKGNELTLLTKYVFKCTHWRMSITPKAIQDLLDELEASKQSRLRAWNVLQRLRSLLSELGNIPIPPPVQKTFDAEGEALEHALTKSFRIRNEAIKSLCSSVRRFRDATVKPECKRDDPHALQAL